MTRYDDDRVITLLREVEAPPAPADRLQQVTRRARAAESRRMTALACVLGLVMAGGVAGAVSLAGEGSQQVLTVADSARATQSEGSARITMRTELKDSKVTQLADGMLMTLSGPIDFERDRFVLRGDFNGLQLEVRGIGRDRWTRVTGSFQNSGFPAGAGLPGSSRWQHHREDGASAAGEFDALDPSALLRKLAASGTTLSSRTVGDRTVSVIRIDRQVLGFGAVEPGLVEVAVQADEEGRIRSLTSEDTSTGMGTVATTFTFDDFGVEVDVTAPPADQVDERGASTGSGSSSFSDSVTISPSPPSAQEREAMCRMLEQFGKKASQGSAREKEAYEQLAESIGSQCPRR